MLGEYEELGIRELFLPVIFEGMAPAGILDLPKLLLEFIVGNLDSLSELLRLLLDLTYPGGIIPDAL